MSSSQKKVTLKSLEGETFEVEEKVALESQKIKQMVEDGRAEDVIELPEVSSMTLLKVLEYCKKHVEARGEKKENELKNWDLDFVKVDQRTLFDLVNAANYLNIKCLLNLTCLTFAKLNMDWNPAEILKNLNIK